MANRLAGNNEPVSLVNPHIDRVGIMGFLDKIKGLASQNAGAVNSAIDKVGDIVDEKTEGKYKGVVDGAQEAAKKAVTGDQPAEGNEQQ